jgi:molecular chaperone DnaK
MYERAQAEQQASAASSQDGSPNGANGASSPSDEEVVDAEVVDEQR